MTKKSPIKTPPDRTTRILRWYAGFALGIVLILGLWAGIAWLATPPALRTPAWTHFHFRMQVISDGKPVDFAAEKFQTAFDKDNCSAKLTNEPTHFHDNLDQFVHIHWTGVTGGVLLKNYGWNFIGGFPGKLGYRFDQFPRLSVIPDHGVDLPRPKEGSKYYVYTGDQDSYRQRAWGEFLDQDLRNFFTGKGATKLTDRTPAPEHDHDAEGEKARLHDLVGSVIIFVQPEPPTDAQIKDRFDKLIPLPESSCAG